MAIKTPQALSIKNWALEDRPREKLLLKGTSSLSPAELLAILIGSGTRNESAVELAKKMLKAANNNINELAKFDIKQLTKFKGIGEAKAVTIAAALELGRRRKSEEILQRKTILSTIDSFEYFRSYLGDLAHEEFHYITLNNASLIIEHHRLSKGGLSGTTIDPRIILRQALMNNASKIILAHNHPSGSLKPSDSDILITKKIKEAAKIMDITLLDHLIITQDRFYSFAESNAL